MVGSINRLAIIRKLRIDFLRYSVTIRQAVFSKINFQIEQFGNNNTIFRVQIAHHAKEKIPREIA